MEEAPAALQGYLPAICIALVCAVGGTVLTLSRPGAAEKKLTNVITDGILTGIDLNAVSDIGALLVCFYAASMLLSSVQSWTLTTVTQRVAKRCARIFPQRSTGCRCRISTAPPPAISSRA